MFSRPRRIEPQPGQESVWDYPRPPRLEPCTQKVEIIFNCMTIAQSNRSMRVLETSHPPTYYIPPEDIAQAYLEPNPRQSFCEWKGRASYYNLVVPNAEGLIRRVDQVAWSYANPTEPFWAIRDYLSFYAEPMDACFVDGEKVQPQPGNFYGGWVTSKVVGPFKGGAGSWGW
ncbi:MAG: DUF427 domain-containing protein [Prochlorotrichaceae cyanobacterium]